MIHHHGALLVVDLRIDACVADQIDNPFLAFVLAKAESGGEVPVVMLSDQPPLCLGGNMTR